MTAALMGAVALAGCTASTAPSPSEKSSLSMADWQPKSAKARKANPERAPIAIRVFKEEGVLEIWTRGGNGRYELADSFEICKWSGKLGPKFLEGDRQAPEGFYTVTPGQMNPNSKYHLAFNIGFPNTFDRANGRTGSHLMVHGACSSAGCYSMTDEQIELIYAYAREAFRGGQKSFQIQAYPFRMTAENMARYKDDPNYGFWMNLKEGYDHFELTKVPPKVDVCERRYVFNRIPVGGASFEPTATCPASSMPEALTTAYSAYQSSWDKSFKSASSFWKASVPPSPTISGPKEAALVAEWSKRRARGERVTPEPLSPSIASAAEIKRAEEMVRLLEERKLRAGMRTRMPAVVADIVPQPSPAIAKKRF